MKYKNDMKNVSVSLKDIHPNIKNPRKGWMTIRQI